MKYINLILIVLSVTACVSQKRRVASEDVGTASIDGKETLPLSSEDLIYESYSKNAIEDKSEEARLDVAQVGSKEVGKSEDYEGAWERRSVVCKNGGKLKPGFKIQIVSRASYKYLYLFDDTIRENSRIKNVVHQTECEFKKAGRVSAIDNVLNFSDQKTLAGAVCANTPQPEGQVVNPESFIYKVIKSRRGDKLLLEDKSDNGASCIPEGPTVETYHRIPTS